VLLKISYNRISVVVLSVISDTQYLFVHGKKYQTSANC